MWNGGWIGLLIEKRRVNGLQRKNFFLHGLCAEDHGKILTVHYTPDSQENSTSIVNGKENHGQTRQARYFLFLSSDNSTNNNMKDHAFYMIERSPNFSL